MIDRAILEAQRGMYVAGREQAIAQVNGFNGGIDAIDNLLRILDQRDEAIASADGAEPQPVPINAPAAHKEESNA